MTQSDHRMVQAEAGLVLNKVRTEITMTMLSSAASTSAEKAKHVRAVVFHPAREVPHMKCASLYLVVSLT